MLHLELVWRTPINFHEESGIVTFAAMNSAHLSMCQKGVRPSVQKRWRTMAFSRVSRPHLAGRGKSHGFFELRQAPRVYSRVTTGMPILNGSLFSEVRTLV